jgi:hypothetical protein
MVGLPAVWNLNYREPSGDLFRFIALVFRCRLGGASDHLFLNDLHTACRFN